MGPQRKGHTSRGPHRLVGCGQEGQGQSGWSLPLLKNSRDILEPASIFHPCFLAPARREAVFPPVLSQVSQKSGLPASWAGLVNGESRCKMRTVRKHMRPVSTAALGGRQLFASKTTDGDGFLDFLLSEADLRGGSWAKGFMWVIWS